MVTLKLAVLWDIFLHYQWSKSPTFFKDSEWMTCCPTNFYKFAIWQFFWSELLRRNIENWAEFWCFKRFLWLSFFLFCQPRFQSTLIVMNIYWKGQVHSFFTLICVEEVFSQFFCNKINIFGFFFKFCIQMVVSLPDQTHSWVSILPWHGKETKISRKSALNA